MAQFTVTREGGVITIHESDHHSPAVATFDGFDGEQLFDALIAGATAAGTHTFWDANRADYLRSGID
jgi:hypothetical protein